MRQLRTAIIGCGAIFNVHADAVKKHEKSVLKAVVDIDKGRGKKAASDCECSYYSDYKQMLKDEEIDVTHICTPHYLHAPMSVDCLRAGKHVLVEKPLAESLRNARRIKKETAERGAKLGVVLQNRYNEASRRAKEIIESGDLGEIKGVKGLVTWHRGKDYYNSGSWRGRWDTEGGGILINQAIHTLDLMQWLVGEVTAVRGNYDTRLLEGTIEVEDTAEATLYFDSGITGIFYATNCFSTNAPIEVGIHGEKGFIKLSYNDLYIQKEGKLEKIYDDQEDSPYKSYWGKGHEDLIFDFYDYLLKGEGNYISAAEGIKSMEIVNAIYRSAEINGKYHI